MGFRLAAIKASQFRYVNHLSTLCSLRPECLASGSVCSQAAQMQRPSSTTSKGSRYLGRRRDGFASAATAARKHSRSVYGVFELEAGKPPETPFTGDTEECVDKADNGIEHAHDGLRQCGLVGRYCTSSFAQYFFASSDAGAGMQDFMRFLHVHGPGDETKMMICAARPWRSQKKSSTKRKPKRHKGDTELPQRFPRRSGSCDGRTLPWVLENTIEPWGNACCSEAARWTPTLARAATAAGRSPIPGSLRKNQVGPE